MDAKKIKNYDKIMPIFTKGKLTPGKVIGDQGTAPKKVASSKARTRTTFANGATEWVTLIPTDLQRRHARHPPRPDRPPDRRAGPNC